jgi:hypothetical protein
MVEEDVDDCLAEEFALCNRKAVPRAAGSRNLDEVFVG